MTVLRHVLPKSQVSLLSRLTVYVDIIPHTLIILQSDSVYT